MDKEFVISYLKTRNYWWQTREVSPADKGIHRHEYIEKIRAIEKLERIVCLSGIRRSGKTTILYQYIDHLLKNADAEPQKVVYVKVDDLLRKMDSIHDVLNIPFKGLFVPYYWKNQYEVDFIYDDSMCVLPVEVKYRHHQPIREGSSNSCTHST
jgi:predicted AAA+ superfamily ATPase